jgi:uncharacterized protein
LAAQTNLGVMFENGRGVEKDPAQAAQWYRRAADKGNAQAQFNLGDLYEAGRGVDKDLNQALDWFRKAAKQGYGDAAQRVERLERSQRTGAGSSTSDRSKGIVQKYAWQPVKKGDWLRTDA